MNRLDFAVETAQEAGDLLTTYFKRNENRYSYKPDHSIVTNADLAADKYIHNKLQENFPDDDLLSEEIQTTTPTDQSSLWVVDPLDGTTNFSLGLHYWGVSIAHIKNGQPNIAALFFPLLKETFTAKVGEGAFLNGERLHVRQPHRTNSIPFFSCCSRSHRLYEITVKYKTRILGSAAYGLCTVASGISLLAFEATPKLWDFTGSWLIVSEAGGIVQAHDGSTPFPPLPDSDYSKKSYPILAAASQELFTEAQDQIHQIS